MNDENTFQTLLCGCRMGSDAVTGMFIFEPHSLDCEYYLHVLAEAERQGKPVTTLDLR